MGYLQIFISPHFFFKQTWTTWEVATIGDEVYFCESLSSWQNCRLFIFFFRILIQNLLNRTFIKWSEWYWSEIFFYLLQPKFLGEEMRFRHNLVVRQNFFHFQKDVAKLRKTEYFFSEYLILFFERPVKIRPSGADLLREKVKKCVLALWFSKPWKRIFTKSNYFRFSLYFFRPRTLLEFCF